MSLSLVTKKCKLKPDGDTTTHPLGWLKLKGLTISSAVEQMKQLDLSLIAGGCANTSII